MRRTIARLAVLLIFILTPLFVVSRLNAQVVPGEVSAVSASDLSDTPAGVMLANDQLDISLTVLCSDGLWTYTPRVLCEASVDYCNSIVSPLNSEPERFTLTRYADEVGNT